MSFTSTALPTSNGLSATSSSVAPTTSNVALDGEVDALEDGRAQLEQRDRLAGHELRLVGEDLHRRGRDADGHAAAVALVDQLDGPILGKVGVGDDHLVDVGALEHRGQLLDRTQRAQPVVGPRVERDVAGELEALAGVGERVRDRLDVLARADEDGPPVVAGGAQQDAGDPLVEVAQRSHVDGGEEQRPVEDVVAGEALPAEQREQQRHHGHREQRPDDSGQARALGARARTDPSARTAGR